MSTGARRWTIRQQLAAMAAAVLVPVGVVIISATVHSANQSRALAVRNIETLAAQTADRLVNVLDDRQRMLAAFAERPRVRALDPRNCDPGIADYVTLNPGHNTLGTRDRSGSIVCSFIANPPPASDVVGSAWFDGALRSGKFTASDAHFGRPTGQWVTVLTHPIRDEAGEVAGIAVLAVNLLRLGERVLKSAPDDTVIYVFDRRQQVLLRSAEPEKWIGQAIADSDYPQQARAGGVGYLSTSGFDGVERVYAYRTIPSTGWTVFAGMPEELVYAAHAAYMRAAGWIVLAALVLALVLGRRFAQRIVAPLRDLEAVAQSVTAGNLVIRASESGSAELRRLAQAFNRMLDARATAERSLQASEARLRRTFETAAEGIYTVDAAYQIDFANLRLQTLLGYTPDELIGRSPLSLLDEESRARASTGMARRYDGVAEQMELTYLRKDGQPRLMLLNAAPIMDDQGSFIGAIGMLSDITERARSAEALRKANRQLQLMSSRLLDVQEAERAAIARELHDEIGQSLTAIKLGALGLAKIIGSDPAGGIASLVAIADRALGQTRSLTLDLRPPQLDQLGLSAALRDTLRRVGGAAGIATRLETDPPDLTVENRLAVTAFRIVQEAITNAIRHSGARQIAVALHATHDALELIVDDDGRGFELDAVRTAALQGQCAGLLGMEERAALAGGELRIETRPGQGTRVRARLPCQRPKTALG